MPKDTAPVIDDSKTTEEVLETIVVPAPVPSLVRKDGGVYLTDQQLLEAEIQRATLEKREPDFSYFYGEEFLQDAPGSVVEDEEPNA